jgi:hypothetical protein
MLIQNIEKAAHMVGHDYDAKDPLRNYGALTQESILEAQTRSLANEGVVKVLCTCLWFIIDYGLRRLGAFLSSYAI